MTLTSWLPGQPPWLAHQQQPWSPGEPPWLAHQLW